MRLILCQLGKAFLKDALKLILKKISGGLQVLPKRDHHVESQKVERAWLTCFGNDITGKGAGDVKLGLRAEDEVGNVSRP